jgi:hypothetical protein
MRRIAVTSKAILVMVRIGSIAASASTRPTAGRFAMTKTTKTA